MSACLPLNCCLQILLMAALDAPDTGMYDLPLLPEAARDQVLVAFNRTEVPFPADMCMHQLFEQQAAAQPRAPCILWKAGFLSYAEVDKRANQVANYLLRLPGDPLCPVAVLMDKCPDLYIAILGVLKSGRPYVPLDPDYPPERLAFSLEDAGANVLVTHKRFAALLPTTRGIHVGTADLGSLVCFGLTG